MITVVSDYFDQGCGRCERFDTPECSTKRWAAGLKNLRRLCLEADLAETAKWGHPCYVHTGRNVALIGALRNDFRLSFFNAELMKDPEGVLEKPGPNTQAPDMIRFTQDSQVLKMTATIRAYLEEAKGYAEAGIRPKKNQPAIEIPTELAEAMAGDPGLAAAFRRLTPGRQRSYVINLSSAKKSQTRIARIEKFREKILAGKGALER